MGLLSGLFGNASQVDVESLRTEYAPVLVEGEELLAGFKVIRVTFVFTSKRMILVDKQGLTGIKREYLSIPFSSITCFSMESAGIGDFDAELKIWVQGQPDPIVKEVKSGSNAELIYRLIGEVPFTPLDKGVAATIDAYRGLLARGLVEPEAPGRGG